MPTDTPVRKSKPAFVPAYRRIEADLRGLIDSGSWPAGSLIPGRRELAKNYGVDLNTVQNAIRGLLDDGTLRAEGRSGTYVAGAGQASGRGRGLEAVTPLWGLRSDEPRSTTTVGIIGALWGYNETTRDPHDNWPAAILHAFECAMAVMPDSTVKFREIHHDDGGDRELPYYERLRELMAEGVDALAFISPPESMVADLEEIARRHKLPIVLIHHEAEGFGNLPSVSFDFEFGGFQAAHHLLLRGYENISVFNPYIDANYAPARIAGVELALRRAGRSLRRAPGDLLMPRAHPKPQGQRDNARLAARAYLAERLPSWGIVAVNDHAGHGLIDAAHDLGLTVGVDFGLIGFDDSSESRRLDMSSLHPPLDAMGTEAAKLLRSMLDGQQATTDVRLRSNLVARTSSQLRSGGRPLTLEIESLRNPMPVASR
ncbi:MAG TPA: substrate-binding domain-containing protein [Capsulimonadaceae bacterium]|jgi:DNA-binding LacI/PurR family transcriptional regulator